ncbi:MAG: TraX family protein [Candidatus Paceibacterota bacterium]
MNSFQIKVLAVVAMIVDHIGFVFFPQITVLRIIGRLAFPLFAFLVSEGFIKTSNRRRYFFRLTAFAIISHIPYIYMIRAGGGEGTQLNIFFTLSIGLLCLILVDRYKDLYLRTFIVGAVLLVAMLFRFEYGAYGVLLILSSYLFIKSHIKGLASIFFISIFNVFYRIVYLATHLQIYALGAIPFMYLYNGQKGPDGYRNWFYYIYPVHMVVIALLAYIIK